MCFSAPVSFIASGVLAAAGAGALRHAGTSRLRWYAAVPLIFSVQQFIEGLQWLAAKPSPESTLLGYVFLFFAFLLWPVYMPMAACIAERDPGRKDLLRLFVTLGALVSLAALFVLLTRPLSVTVVGQCLNYYVDIPWAFAAVGAYVTAVCASAFFSSRPGIRRFGLAGIVSFSVSAVFYLEVSTSVWCFFAAVLSAMIYLDLRSYGRSSEDR